MCFSLRESVIAFVVITFIVIILWVRNVRYDRLLAPVLFVVGLIQLAETFYYLGYDPNRVGFAIFVILWLQTLVLAVSLYCYYRTTLTLIWMVLFIIIFTVALVYGIRSTFTLSKSPAGYTVWNQNGGSILGNWGWLYLVGLLVPFLVVQYYAGWKDIGMWILLGVLVLSAIIVYFVYPKVSFPSLWCYAAVAVVFTAYLIGAFPGPCHE